ncbi:DUF429 domain-containing protein [Brevibacterium yomogidense]|uniref:DUF429 domain-containing protein n=1 Tax=Brevibacterium yomogidense TaxID=946573 RepID=UPI0018E012D0
MFTIGVDLAAGPEGTALARIDWTGTSAGLVRVQVGIDDSPIVDASRGATAVGIDCAFGWPVEFVDFLTEHASGRLPPRSLTGKDWRRQLSYRHTDRFVRDITGRWPLSVATDRLGLTAMRCAELLSAFSLAGEDVDRSGSGRLVEVYPAAALRCWDIPVAGYKRHASKRIEALDNLLSAAPRLEITPDQRVVLERSDDAFDAVVSALVAGAHARGHTSPPPHELQDAAQVEGWIALPTSPLESIVSPADPR